MIGACCFLMVLLSTRMVQHPVSSLLSGQAYTLQVGGNQTDETTSKNTATISTAGVTRINQTDAAQYLNTDQYNAWYQSACSAAAITMVLNAYGHHYRIGDVLSVEIAIKAISQTQGLLSAEGIDRTAQHFGFATQTLPSPTLRQVLDIANSGKPVLINFPPGTDWGGGHFLVVTGGTPEAIQLADSSSINGGNGLQVVYRSYMQRNWRGFAKILTPSKN
jgi:hypothetical protein